MKQNVQKCAIISTEKYRAVKYWHRRRPERVDLFASLLATCLCFVLRLFTLGKSVHLSIYNQKWISPFTVWVFTVRRQILSGKFPPNINIDTS